MSTKKIRPIDICIIFMLLCYPIVFSKNYEDIVDTKYVIFIVCAISIICLYLGNYVFSLFFARNDMEHSTVNNKRIRLQDNKKLSITDIMMLVFLIVLLCSFLQSNYKYTAFFGSSYDKMGLLYFILLILLYFVLSRLDINKNLIVICISLSFFTVVFTAGLQFMGYDLFGLIKTIRPDIRINYLSFMGNTNIFSAYICLFTPVFMCGAVLSETIKAQIFYQLLSFTGFFGLFLANSDGGYPGILSSFICIMYIAAGSRKRIKRFIYVIMNFFICSYVFYLIHSLLNEYARPISLLTRKITYNNNSLLFVLILTILLFIVDKIKGSPNSFIILRRFIRICILISFILIAGLIIYANYVNKDFNLGGINKYIIFSKDWGTGRGYVWLWSFEVFNNSLPLKQFFGNGLSTTGLILINEYGSIMKNSLGYYFSSSHNEYLELLLNIGILGLVSYISLFISTIIYIFKNFSSFGIMFVCGIIAYSVQCSFTVLQPVVFPLVFVFMALANNKKIVSE